MTLIFRYLLKEVFVTLASLTAILMLIFMSNQFVRYLNRAAAGQIPGMVIVKLMMLEMPNLMGLLLPLGFYVTLLIAYGRLYADSEMTILQACGYGPRQLLKHSYTMAVFVAGFVMILMFWVSPMISTERTKLIRTSGLKTLIQTILPGRFIATKGGQQVLYVDTMSRDHSKAQGVFFARQVTKNNQSQWDILTAKAAFLEKDPLSVEDYIILKEGKTYEGSPGKAAFSVAEFEQQKTRLPEPTVMLENDVRTLKTSKLWPMNNPDRKKAAELQWRFSVPIMVLVLTFVAIPLSRVNPRSGKFAKILPAILIYILYANFMFVSRDWIIEDKIPLWLGLWWLHAVVILLGLFLWWRNKVKMA